MSETDGLVYLGIALGMFVYLLRVYLAHGALKESSPPLITMVIVALVSFSVLWPLTVVALLFESFITIEWRE